MDIAEHPPNFEITIDSNVNVDESLTLSDQGQEQEITPISIERKQADIIRKAHYPNDPIIQGTFVRNIPQECSNVEQELITESNGTDPQKITHIDLRDEYDPDFLEDDDMDQDEIELDIAKLEDLEDDDIQIERSLI